MREIWEVRVGDSSDGFRLMDLFQEREPKIKDIVSLESPCLCYQISCKIRFFKSDKTSVVFDFVVHSHKTLEKFTYTNLPIKIHSCTDLILYVSIDHFVMNSHTDTPTKVSCNRKLSHLTHFFYMGVVTLTQSRLGNSWTDLSYFSISFPLKTERERSQSWKVAVDVMAVTSMSKSPKT